MSEVKMKMNDTIFTHGLCHFLRQRPKIERINEARDEKMSEILAQSAGSRVTSTIHL